MTETLLQVFFDQVQRLGQGRAAMRQKRHGHWHTWSWKEYGEQVIRTAYGLRALGVESGSRIAILAGNGPEWLFADMAVMALGGAAAGIYPNELAQGVEYVTRHCAATVLVVDSPAQLAKTALWRDELPGLRAVVIIHPDLTTPLGGKVLSWEQLLERGAAAYAADGGALERQARQVRAGDLAMLVYTSGTTGPSKGAMYSHSNLLFEARALKEIMDEEGMSTLSFLPLCHIAERLQAELVGILAGTTVNFAESLEKVKDNLLEVRPTVMLAVPRLWEKFYAALQAKFAEATGAKKLLIERTLRVGSQVATLRNAGQAIPLPLLLQWLVLRRLVVDKLKAALGFDRCRLFLSGAAPLNKTIAEFFGALDMDIHEAYGQTECVGVSNLNPRSRVRFGTVGKSITGCAVRIAADGEILVKGPNVFLGYLNDPAGTAEAVDTEGWLHTGDVGEFTSEGYLRITDRKKDIIVTAGGKNVAPQNIEGKLKTYPGISQAVIIGDKMKYLVALITLDPLAAPALCASLGLEPAPVSDLAQVPAVRARVQTYVDAVNATEPQYARIKYFAILPRDLSLEEGEITPSLKVKRRVVQQKHAVLIESMQQAQAD